MSHTCVYKGNDGCLLSIPFRYVTGKGWPESFANPLIVTTLAKALCAATEPLYKQPSLKISCKNLSTFCIVVI